MEILRKKRKFSENFGYIILTNFDKFVQFIKIKGGPKTGACSLLDGLATPSIGIPTKCSNSVVHYLSNRHPQTSVCKIDLK